MKDQLCKSWPQKIPFLDECPDGTDGALPWCDKYEDSSMFIKMKYMIIFVIYLLITEKKQIIIFFYKVFFKASSRIPMQA